jgi:hypothetical protein
VVTAAAAPQSTARRTTCLTASNGERFMCRYRCQARMSNTSPTAATATPGVRLSQVMAPAHIVGTPGWANW